MRSLSMNKIRQLISLSLEKNFKNREIARALKISHPIVGKYLSNFKKSGISCTEIETMTDDALLDILNGGQKKKNNRYNDIAGLFSEISTEMKRKGVTLYLLWQEYKKTRPTLYSYSQFCYYYQLWRASSALSMHIEHKAGDKMFCDFTGHKWTIYNADDTAAFDAEIFISLLGASLLTYAEAAKSQKLPEWIKLNENALHYFGGVPSAIVPDNLKSAVQKSDKYDPDINPEYADFAEHYDTVILPARPYRPKDKALVENAVRLFYSSFMAPLRDRKFYSMVELNIAIKERLEIFNNRTMQGYKKSRRALFEEIERAALKPLAVERYAIREFLKLKVHINYHVFVTKENHYYSVPYQYRGKDVLAVFSGRFIEIFYNNMRIAFHERGINPEKYTTLPEHMHPNHKFVSGWCPEKFISWGKKTGDDVANYISEILTRAKHPEQAYKICLGILSMVKKIGNVRLNNACRRAHAGNSFSYKTIKNILENNLDKSEILIVQPAALPFHQNIRGAAYYSEGQK